MIVVFRSCYVISSIIGDTNSFSMHIDMIRKLMEWDRLKNTEKIPRETARRLL